MPCECPVTLVTPVTLVPLGSSKPRVQNPADGVKHAPDNQPPGI